MKNCACKRTNSKKITASVFFLQNHEKILNLSHDMGQHPHNFALENQLTHKLKKLKTVWKQRRSISWIATWQDVCITMLMKCGTSSRQAPSYASCVRPTTVTTPMPCKWSFLTRKTKRTYSSATFPAPTMSSSPSSSTWVGATSSSAASARSTPRHTPNGRYT